MGLDHTPAELSGEQRANLGKLSGYLLALPADCQDFSMSDFSQDGVEYAHVIDCGTVACAAGHGPNAGVEPRRNEDWFEYVERAFCADDSIKTVSAWQYMFGAGWWAVDNTPHGAADRIAYVLAHGTPSNQHDQMRGRAPLSYRAQVSA